MIQEYTLQQSSCIRIFCSYSRNLNFDRRKDLQRINYFKSIGDKNVESLKEYKKLGYMIGAVDEEGMMFLMKNIIVSPDI